MIIHTGRHIYVYQGIHICLLTSFVTSLDIKALTDNCFACVNYGIVFVLNALYLITSGISGFPKTVSLGCL